MSSVTWIIPAGSDAPATVADLAPGQVDHVARAIARLPEQFKSKTKIVALLTALVGPAQALEAALWQLLTERSIDVAVGAQLDDIGVIVGQDRGGLSDDDYRRYLRARVAANRSRGTTEDMILVADLILDDPSIQIQIDWQNGAVVVRLLGGATSNSLAGIMISFLRDAVTSGIRVILESSAADDAHAFTTARGSFLVAMGSGSPLLQPFAVGVDGNLIPTSFPTSGQFIIDRALATQETVTYTSRDASFFYLSGVTAFAHAAHAFAELVEGNEGLGDSTQGGQPSLTPYAPAGTTGGRMADARL